MKVFFDSSAFVKRFMEEDGSREVDAYCEQAASLGLGVICVSEIVSALNRKLRERVLSKEDYQRIKRQIVKDIEDAQIIKLTPEVVKRSVRLLEQHALRSLDALHIACALEWGADVFVSSDKRQLQASRDSGMDCRNPVPGMRT
uniref:Predicted nucleic acid-binding protein, contains PIN domain n=1 Tax=Candidatus Kentrum sp. SD TaxID=2126332 RepID=A0A450Z731_9GAMM|nr:MAG: Predicted nucleic acid-binding protein, contains PIN domain [Candidatus Kentron sp. SD]VFK49607.1 MAG: Predicted nucleic acid-binding protein, contains PIN domain [Candidatus Kentron sp. SD]